MSDDREFWDDDQSELADDASVDDFDTGTSDDSGDMLEDDAYALLSADDFDEELEALGDFPDAELELQDDRVENGDRLADNELDVIGDDEALDDGLEPDVESDGSDGTLISDAEAAALEAEERLRQPRAGRFRRTRHNQIGMLPLALLLLGLGAYLIARAQDVSDLPDIADGTLAVISVVMVGFTAFFHALLSGRRERGLLFVGLMILTTAGLIAGLVYGVDDNPAASEWWPLLFWSTGVALLFTYVVERTHDIRLVLLAIIVIVAGTTAYLVSSEQIDSDALSGAADYWPLLLSVLGVGLIPLVFRRRIR